MQKWEYVILVRRFYSTGHTMWVDEQWGKKSGEEVLDECGAHGYELVSTVNVGETKEALKVYSTLQYILKRPKA